MRELLLPHTTIVTPNSMEARRLADVDDDDDASLALCAERLIAMGAEYVLITGTHEATPEVVNTLYGEERCRAQRHVAAAARQLPRLRLHARLRDRRDARQRPRPPGGRARSAGLHVAHAARRPIVRAWGSSCPIACSGRARRPRRPRRTPPRRTPPMPTAATDDRLLLRRARARRLARALRGDAGHRGHRGPRRARRSGARRRRQRDPVPQQGGGPGATARPGRGARPRSRAAGRSLIVNDDAALAAAVGADGVHLGEDDGSIAAARELLGPDRIIGVSCYDDFERARAGVAAGADYVAFGSFFPSSVKPGARRAAVALLERARIARRAGGRDRRHHRGERGRPARAGAHAVAVITAVFGAPDVEAAARAIASAVASNRHRVAPRLTSTATIPDIRAPDEPQRRALRPRPAHDPRRRQFAGARVPLRRRHAALLRPRRRRVPVGRRRPSLHRLRRLVGTGDPRPCAPGGRPRGAGNGASADCRSARRPRSRSRWRRRSAGCCLRSSWCASCRRAPRRRCRRCGSRAATPAAARS